MTSTPETIPTSQENPEQPRRWAFVRSILSSLVHEAASGLMRGLNCLFAELTEIFLKAFFIFLFVNVCALSILFMGDYIFCNSAHTARFIAIASIIASHMTVQNVLSFIGLYCGASLLQKIRTDLESVAAINISKTRPHTPD